MAYDSTEDTLDHIRKVQRLLLVFETELEARAAVHDQSKLEDPEKPLFDEWTPKLKELTYGSDEYKAALASMGPALAHHYAVNSHHPEHYEFGVSEMSLLDVVEMFCDWKAASERHTDGNFVKSLEQNRERFGLALQLYEIFDNTAKLLGW